MSDAATHPYPDTGRADALPAPHPLLAPVLGLLGTWYGQGKGEYPTLDGEFGYAQEVSFRHDGRPFLHYDARAWIIDAEGTPVRPAAREAGWWRLQPDGRVEALITQPTGIAELAVGTASGDTVELATGEVALTPTAKHVDATRRSYTLTPDGGALTYTHAMAAVKQPMQHHLAARLTRRDLP